MSADFSYLTLRNLTAYQPNGGRVPSNYILTVSSNGAGSFTNVISPSSINASSIITSTLCTNMLEVNILSTSVSVSNNIVASTVTTSTISSLAILDKTGTTGTNGQVLKADGFGKFAWQTDTSGTGIVESIVSGVNITVNSASANNPIVNLNSTITISTLTTSTISSLTILDKNGSVGTNNQVLLTTGSSGVVWSTVQSGTTLPNGAFKSDYLSWNGSAWVASASGNVYLGNNAGSGTYGSCIALGTQAGQITQGYNSIALGVNAGQNTQGNESIAIGGMAGQTNQGPSSIAIGNKAGYSNQSSNTIVLNASGVALNTTSTNALYIKPIRNEPVNTNNILQYNTGTNEITYTGPSNVRSVSTLTASTISSLSILDKDGASGSLGQYLVSGGNNVKWSTISVGPAETLTSVVSGINITVNSTNESNHIVNLNSTITVSSMTTSTIKSNTIQDSGNSVGTDSQVLTAGVGGQVVWRTISGPNNSLLNSQTYYSGTNTISIGTIAGGGDGIFAVVISGCGGGGGGGSGASAATSGAGWTPQGGGGGGGAGDGGTYTVYCAHTDTLTVTVGGGGIGAGAPTTTANGNQGGKGGDTYVRFSNAVAGLYFYGGAGGGGGILNTGGGAGGSGAFAGGGGGQRGMGTGGISGTSFKSPFTTTVAAPTSGYGGNGVSSGAFSGGGGGVSDNYSGNFFGGGGGGGASLFADGGRGGTNGTTAVWGEKYGPDNGGGFGAGAGGGAGFKSLSYDDAAQGGGMGGAGFVRISVYKY